MKLSMIYATDPNGVIGGIDSTGHLTQPFHSPKDFRWFKHHTHNKAIVMGVNTYKDIGKPLPNRLSIVLSRDGFQFDENLSNITDCYVAKSIHAAIKEAEAHGYNEIVFIGGASVYETVQHFVDTMYVTKFNQYAGFAPHQRLKDYVYFIPSREDFTLTQSTWFEDKDQLTNDTLTGEFMVYETNSTH